MSKKTYKINYGGKEETITGVNLETALSDHGFKDIVIEPSWRGKSNGKYIAFCGGRTNQVRCEWVEKVKRLAST